MIPPNAALFIYLGALCILIVVLSYCSQWFAFRWRVAYRNSKRGQRLRKKARQYQQGAKQRRKEAQYEGYAKDVIIALDAIKQELYSANDESAPQNKSDRRWHIAEVFGLWAAAIVGITAIIIGSRDASEQRRVMAGQLADMDAEQRAWIKVDTDITGDLILSPNPKISLKIILKNVGKSPAVDTWVYAALFPFIHGTDLINESRRRCVEMREDIVKRQNPEPPEPVGYVIFPDTAATIVSTPTISDQDFKQWRSAQSWPTLFLNLVICADYRLSESSAVHYTDLLYAVGTIDIDKSFTAVIVSPEGSNQSQDLDLAFDGRRQVVSKDKIRLYLDPFGGSNIY
jgi:hypothetical protein